ncbi:MAG: GDSL-type esterase/lipase family protein [Demequinaceae bacterium]|nr:GDSL-type esterase/lipase family protein [Demequinaceae bacterium]
MSRIRLITAVAALVASILVGASAAPEAGPSSSSSPDAIRVMFLGESLTGGPGCWRAEVWRNLSDDGYNVDMVGPFTRDDCGGVTDAEGRVWDPDNAGYGGITTFGVTAKVVNRGLLTNNPPDVIVMLLGTNDVRAGSTVQEVLDQYTFLLGLFRDYVPDVTVVIGTLPPIGPSDCTDCQSILDELNPLIPGWAESASTPKSPVTAAVIHTDLDVATDTVDDLHPNASGNAKIAAAFLPAIEAALDDVAARRDSSPLAGILVALAVIATVAGVFLYWRSRRAGAPGAQPRQTP